MSTAFSGMQKRTEEIEQRVERMGKQLDYTIAQANELQVQQDGIICNVDRYQRELNEMVKTSADAQKALNTPQELGTKVAVLTQLEALGEEDVRYIHDKRAREQTEGSGPPQSTKSDLHRVREQVLKLDADLTRLQNLQPHMHEQLKTLLGARDAHRDQINSIQETQRQADATGLQKELQELHQNTQQAIGAWQE